MIRPRLRLFIVLAVVLLWTIGNLLLLPVYHNARYWEYVTCLCPGYYWQCWYWLASTTFRYLSAYQT